MTISDPNASKETKRLYDLLKSSSQVLLGHQHTVCYGVGWENRTEKATDSDVKHTTGKMPSLFGWDFGHQGTKYMAELIVDINKKSKG